jgi:hypothetical protein
MFLLGNPALIRAVADIQSNAKILCLCQPVIFIAEIIMLLASILFFLWALLLALLLGRIRCVTNGKFCVANGSICQIILLRVVLVLLLFCQVRLLV